MAGSVSEMPVLTENDSNVSTRGGAEVFVETLAVEGVRYVFGIPGEHCLSIIDAISSRDDINFISVRHESAAGFMAEAYGKLTNTPAACLGTASVGAANLVAGVNVAFHDSTPMLVIVGQVATNLLGRQAWQEVDLVSMFGPMCRHAIEISHAERLSEQTSKALALTTVNRPGPVLLSVPVDIQDGQAPAKLSAVVRPKGPAPSKEDLRAVVQMISEASRPLLVVGGGIRAGDAYDELAHLVEHVHLPVVTGFRRTDAVSNDSEYYIGALGLSAPQEVKDAVVSADLLVVIGTRLSELTTLRYAFPTPAQKVVHFDIDAQVLTAQPAVGQLAIVSDSKLALRDLAEECERAGVQGPRAWWRSHQETRGETNSLTNILIRQVATTIDRLLPLDAVVTSDAGDFYLDCAPVININAQRRYLGPTSGTMGYGLPAAIAAKCALPESVCVTLCGDGGLMMSIQELETAVRYNINVIVVVFNNSSYGSIIRHQKRRFEGNLVGTELGNPSFADIANLFGATGRSVATAEEFTEAFASALTSGGVELIEVCL